jgi:hypothetical protein
MVLHSSINERNLLVFIIINLQQLHYQIIVLQLWILLMVLCYNLHLINVIC